MIEGDAEDEGGGFRGRRGDEVFGTVGEEALRGLGEEEEGRGSEGIFGGVGLQTKKSKEGWVSWKRRRREDGKRNGIELTSSQQLFPDPHRPVPVSSQMVPWYKIQPVQSQPKSKPTRSKKRSQRRARPLTERRWSSFRTDPSLSHGKPSEDLLDWPQLGRRTSAMSLLGCR